MLKSFETFARNPPFANSTFWRQYIYRVSMLFTARLPVLETLKSCLLDDSG